MLQPGTEWIINLSVLGSVCNFITIYVTMGKSQCLESFGVSGSRLTDLPKATQQEGTELGRHLFIIFLLLTLGSVFDSM